MTIRPWKTLHRVDIKLILIVSDDDSDVEFIKEEHNDDLDVIIVSQSSAPPSCENKPLPQGSQSLAAPVSRNLSLSSNLGISLTLNDQDISGPIDLSSSRKVPNFSDISDDSETDTDSDSSSDDESDNIDEQQTNPLDLASCKRSISPIFTRNVTLSSGGNCINTTNSAQLVPSGDQQASLQPSCGLQSALRPSCDQQSALRPSCDQPLSFQPNSDLQLSIRPSCDQPSSFQPNSDLQSSIRPSCDQQFLAHTSCDKDVNVDSTCANDIALPVLANTKHNNIISPTKLEKQNSCPNPSTKMSVISEGPLKVSPSVPCMPGSDSALPYDVHMKSKDDMQIDIWDSIKKDLDFLNDTGCSTTTSLLDPTLAPSQCFSKRQRKGGTSAFSINSILNPLPTTSSSQDRSDDNTKCSVPDPKVTDTGPGSVNLNQSLSKFPTRSSILNKYLPPKKQSRVRRLFSCPSPTPTPVVSPALPFKQAPGGADDRDVVCSFCKSKIGDRKSSQCLQGHVICQVCLEEKVKLVLTGKTKVCILKADEILQINLNDMNWSAKYF